MLYDSMTVTCCHSTSRASSVNLWQWITKESDKTGYIQDHIHAPFTGDLRRTNKTVILIESMLEKNLRSSSPNVNLALESLNHQNTSPSTIVIPLPRWATYSNAWPPEQWIFLFLTSNLYFQRLSLRPFHCRHGRTDQPSPHYNLLSCSYRGEESYAFIKSQPNPIAEH